MLFSLQAHGDLSAARASALVDASHPRSPAIRFRPDLQSRAHCHAHGRTMLAFSTQQFLKRRQALSSAIAGVTINANPDLGAATSNILGFAAGYPTLTSQSGRHTFLCSRLDLWLATARAAAYRCVLHHSARSAPPALRALCPALVFNTVYHYHRTQCNLTSRLTLGPADLPNSLHGVEQQRLPQHGELAYDPGPAWWPEHVHSSQARHARPPRPSARPSTRPPACPPRPPARPACSQHAPPK